MQFDLFHSIGRIDSVKPTPTDRQTYQEFLRQCREGEAMGYQTIWVAESHFSSEVQKSNPGAVIPNYQGEVGLNADSCQLAQRIFAETKTLGFGTAIFNIVGGNGGPIGAADRIRMLAFLNSLNDQPRRLHIGVAAGRFPFINAPYGIVARNNTERILWSQVQRIIFLEALEIFLRLSRGEVLSSDDIEKWSIDQRFFKSAEEYEQTLSLFRSETGSPTGPEYTPRWKFERLQLVPKMEPRDWDHWMNFVLGSHDPLARDLGLRFADMDIFNLSFTPPEELNKIHSEMVARYAAAGKSWHRRRLPRTVLVFIDPNPKVALARAERCFDTYIEAMRGTVALPSKDTLLSRALIGNSQMICEQLSPDNPKGFHIDDRIMLWFEFNQVDHEGILRQMRQFAEEVAPNFMRS